MYSSGLGNQIFPTLVRIFALDDALINNLIDANEAGPWPQGSVAKILQGIAVANLNPVLVPPASFDDTTPWLILAREWTLDEAAKQWLFGKHGVSPPPDALASIAALTKLEHERWMIERKLDGWTYGPVRDDRRQLHPKLISWDELLRTSPAEAAKDTEQIWAMLRLVSERGKAPVLALDVRRCRV